MAGQEKRSFKLMNEDELSLALIDAQYALRKVGEHRRLKVWSFW